MNDPLDIIVKSQSSWLHFSDPLHVITTYNPASILEDLKNLDAYLKQGKYIAGFISFEAAPGFDLALTTKERVDFPLMVFGVFNEPQIYGSLVAPKDDFHISSWKPSQTAVFYNKSIEAIKAYIASGDTYQVNYTMRLSAGYQGSTYALFYQLVHNQRAAYSSFIKYNKYRICSVSPELFFGLDGNDLLSRPMKGTAARGLSYEQDKQQSEKLFLSEKERAENLMIVDMIRNDMGKICQAGSINVTRLFNTERYPTVWQMTSDVVGKTQAPFSEIMTALFPCASITGAPKARTMQIINELEQTARHIYTGSIGYMTPERKGQFSVAIRTVLLDVDKKKAEYGVGSGIVWDSVDTNEYQECLIKARVLDQKKTEFNLLETMLAEGKDIFLLEYHLKRLANSAEYFGFSFPEDKIRENLQKITIATGAPQKLRLLLQENGQFTIERQPFEIDLLNTPRVALAKKPVNSQDVFLYHKTTMREVYQPAMLQASEENISDVILYNQKGELTESAIANIVIKKNDIFFTPPVQCGLLNGTYRQYLLDRDKIREEVLLIDDLHQADGLFLINSVKKWIQVSFE